MKGLTRNLFDFDAPETLGEKVHFRLLELFIVAFTVRFAWEWGFYIQRIETVLLPLGIANYVDVSFMFDRGISLVNAGLMTLFCGLGFARVTRFAYPAAILLFHLQYAARYCLGEISHGSNFIGMSLLGLALGVLFFEPVKLRRRFALGFMYFFFGLGYTSAALSKLVGTGLDWPHGHHLWLWIAERQVDTISKFGAFEPNWIQQLVLGDYRFGTLVLSFGLLVELFGWLMWWRRTRYFIIPAVIGMHFGIALAMNIFFEVYTYELVLLGFPWAIMLDRLFARIDVPPLRRFLFARMPSA